MNLATDGLGKYLYVIDGTNSTHTGTAIAAFAIGTGTSLGILTPVVGSPFTYPMWLVKGDPTGQFLIGTSGKTAFLSGTDDNNLYVFAITQSGSSAGAITQVTKQPTTNAPYSIAVQSNSGGNLVYSFGFNDTDTAFNPVEGYSLSGSGTLSQVTGSPFTIGEGSWAQFDQSGVYMFTYASFINVNTNVITTQLTPLVVGSTGSLSQPISTFPLITPGFWVVTDPQ